MSAFLTNQSRSVKGFSLVELMISIFLGLLITAGVLALFGNTIKSNRDVLASARLNQELSAVMNIMVNEIRRSGYSAWDDQSPPEFSPLYAFNQGEVPDMFIPASSCIIYSYDQDDSGVIEASEMRGFRRDNNGGIDILTSSTIPDPSLNDCGDTGITLPDGSTGTNNWEPLTDDATISVTAPDGSSGLNFTTTGSSCRNLGLGKGDFTVTSETQAFACDSASGTAAEISSGDRTVDIRIVNIGLVGQLVDDVEVTKELNVAVKVRNNRIQTH